MENEQENEQIGLSWDNDVNSSFPPSLWRDPMPFVCGSFKPGEALAFLDSLEDDDTRACARAEYAYFSGRPEAASEGMEPFLSHEDPLLRFPALTIYCFANLSLGRIRLARFGLSCVQESLARGLKGQTDPQLRAVESFAAETVSTLLHLPSPPTSLADEGIGFLPSGLKLFGLYVLAHRAYIDGAYERSLGMAETALALNVEPYPVPEIYLHLVACMDLMSLRRADEARDHFLAAWEIARPDGLIEAFGEHHGLLQGLVEVCLKRDWPIDYERVIDITYRFSSGWRKLHALQTQEEVADNLTTTEFTVAMLANRGWTNKEIAAHMDISPSTVKHCVSAVYAKLGIANRRELKRYMLR